MMFRIDSGNVQKARRLVMIGRKASLSVPNAQWPQLHPSWDCFTGLANCWTQRQLSTCYTVAVERQMQFILERVVYTY